MYQCTGEYAEPEYMYISRVIKLQCDTIYAPFRHSISLFTSFFRSSKLVHIQGNSSLQMLPQLLRVRVSGYHI